jgi:hypothetical protein
MTQLSDVIANKAHFTCCFLVVFAFIRGSMEQLENIPNSYHITCGKALIHYVA